MTCFIFSRGSYFSCAYKILNIIIFNYSVPEFGVPLYFSLLTYSTSRILLVEHCHKSSTPHAHVSWFLFLYWSKEAHHNITTTVYRNDRSTTTGLIYSEKRHHALSSNTPNQPLEPSPEYRMLNG
jgi:hypothetical protein